jgi:5-methylcytosine-specific restriction enzyme B
LSLDADQRSRLNTALKSWDRVAGAESVKAAEVEHSRILELFPLTGWPEMPLERYALGSGSPDTFGYLMEFGTYELGSIGGGAALKHIIYKYANKPGYNFDSGLFSSAEEAWSRVRAAFVRALELTAEEQFSAVDDIEELRRGQSLLTKTLFVYYPDRLLPIYSRNHLDHFTRILGGVAGSLERVSANRQLFELVYAMAEFESWSPYEVMRFLYSWADPRASHRIVKIAPGRDAKYWEECLAGGYICVGWDKVGDLAEFTSLDEMRQRFEAEYGDDYKGAARAITVKAKEVWTLRDLEAGDVVVANKGTAEVLAIGKVTDPGYVWRQDREEFKHTVNVSWDTTAARKIEPVKYWAVKTVAQVSPELYGRITSGTVRPGGPTAVPLTPLMRDIAHNLERRDQVILYGAPGTGKTYVARRFAVWWLREKAGAPDAAWLLGNPDGFVKAEDELGAPTKDPGFAAQLTRVTFHPSYAYEDFVEGYKPRETQAGGGLELQMTDGIFFRVCRSARADPKRPYLLLIDEINRGNIPKIFGELLTVIERDKRGYTVTLPQSGRQFSVPPNVYILGTMNTADRSIRLLDAALRRRFAFVELTPDPSLLGTTVGPLSLELFLAELNHRIALRLGTEKVVGQSFFMQDGEPVSTVEDFAECMIHDLMPLLQEYAFDDPGVLGSLLGDRLVDKETNRLKDELVADPDRLVDALYQSFKGGSGDDHNP